jgi:ABC-type multidrug transport system ATPase subunit
VTGLSGGERKRTSIAFDLISNPRVLILDEPTSGLDSSTAYRLIKHMRKLCELRNMSIICSIHQPSSLMVQLFDQLQCMSNGHVIYSGPADKALSKYFKANFGLQVPQFYNPADFLINVANGHPNMSIAQDALVAKAKQEIKIRIREQSEQKDLGSDKLQELMDNDKRLQKYGVQLKEICMRMVLLAIRSP